MKHIVPEYHDSHTQPSFSWKNRLARLLWGMVYVILFRLSPRPLHAWRILLLRLFGAKLGQNCHIYPHASIWAPWNLSCEKDVAIADDAILYNQATIFLGEHVVISQGAHLCTGTHEYETLGFPLIAKPIYVSRQSWICAEAFILPGIHIGEGAVIGARAVVTLDMPPWTVCAGHPCRPIKPRNIRC